jgi:hypothetical protein
MTSNPVQAPGARAPGTECRVPDNVGPITAIFMTAFLARPTRSVPQPSGRAGMANYANCSVNRTPCPVNVDELRKRLNVSL